MLQNRLEDHILDGKNPHKCYLLAKEYDKLEQGAMAVSLYLKAADLASSEFVDNKELQYKCMIGIGRCYERQRDRGFTVEGAFLDAVALLPTRPEAHYHLCKHYEGKSLWKHCLIHAELALDNPHIEENCELGFPGYENLLYYQALANWYISGQQNGKQLFFSLKYRNKLKPTLKEKVDRIMDNIWYPDVIPYTAEDFERIKFIFPKLERIIRNHSKHFQDMFVLSCFNGKRNGSYLEIGSGDPFVHNNTALLETEFGWKGISIDNSEALCYNFKEKRNNTVICSDATAIPFENMLNAHCMEPIIDYLQIDCDEASIDILNKIPFGRFKFGVITFEHDSYRLGNERKDAARKLLKEHGYVLAVPNLAFAPGHPYEDWYIHPDVVDLPKEMKAEKDVNFVWDYFMEPIDTNKD